MRKFDGIAANIESSGVRICYRAFSRKSFGAQIFLLIIILSSSSALCTAIHPNEKPTWEQLKCFIVRNYYTKFLLLLTIPTTFQGICKIPNAYNFIQACQFIKFLVLIEKFSKEANQLLEKTLKTGDSYCHEMFDAINNIFFELNEASKLLSSCYGAFLLVSIATQFIVLLNLFYTLFLTISGFIEFSPILVISTLFWICFQICTLTIFVVGCEKFYRQMTTVSKVLWRFNCTSFTKSSNVRNFLDCFLFSEVLF